MSDHEDAELFARLRTAWREIDPMPADLVDRMVAAVATAGLAQEYALLTLVENELGAVRGEADALTLQFSDGTTSILLHVTSSAPGRHRVDGWADVTSAEIVLAQGERTMTTRPSETGRFSFDDVPSGLTSVRLTAGSGDGIRTMSTPLFEL